MRPECLVVEVIVSEFDDAAASREVTLLNSLEL